jgi:formylglycine-generating enzyme required for sulfatase activity
MAGNVAEWIADNYSSTWYHDSMINNLLRDPAFWNPSVQFNVRGGSFRSSIGDVRVSKRSSAKGDNAQMNYVGFRCVKRAP